MILKNSKLVNAKRIHIYPMDDICAHYLIGISCQCSPSLIMECGREIIVHHAFDERTMKDLMLQENKEGL